MPRYLMVRPRRPALHRCAYVLFLMLLAATISAGTAHAGAIITNLTPTITNVANYQLNGPRREFDSDVSFYTQVDTFCVHYMSVLAVDVAALGNTESEGQTCSHKITFKVLVDTNGPQDWTIKLWSWRKGDCTVIDDNGKQATAEVNSSITATAVGVPPLTKSDVSVLQFGTYHVDNNNNRPNDEHQPINDGPIYALLAGTGTTNVTLTFSWGENVISDPDGSVAGGDEAAVRLGLSTTGINRVSAGSYEDLNDRVKANDGHFVCARLCAQPEPVVSGGSFCSPLDNSACTFTAAGTVKGCLGNCYTILCRFYDKNGVMVKAATTSVTNGSLSWLVTGTNPGPCTNAPFTVQTTLIDDACALTPEDAMVMSTADDLPYVTHEVLQVACPGGGGGGPVTPSMPSTTLWGQIAGGVALLLAGALLIRRRYARNHG